MEDSQFALRCAARALKSRTCLRAYQPLVSAKIQVLGDRVKKCSRATAKLKVSRGGFRWLDEFTIVAIPVILPGSPCRPFRFGPAASFTDWAPRDSAGYLVMQLHTSRRQTA